ncbi:hypothetical protein FDP41_002510 [Naegleria fowleri]|uniref:Mediator of RNA polymerase II transcription subunit 25 n=1 Tax=Naegleria fowleri TaxID=5763 RepID=A0A6A5BYP3_NAEFO|nr:uncharacterized protein FDP41_002510 [Naegleria fowleri]KAF0978690.1 hypothetical protein FDP41_002510 [Naegleria fowleri]CAG4708043.1 unnamed protein product [Naegleria fowleri]
MSQQPTSMLSLLTDSSPTLLQPPTATTSTTSHGRPSSLASSFASAFANSLSSPNSNTSLLSLMQSSGNTITDTNSTAVAANGLGPNFVKQQQPSILSRSNSNSSGTSSNSAGFAHPLPADFYLPTNIPQQVCILIDTTGGMRQYFGDFLKKIILPYLEQLKNNNTEYGAVLFQNHPPFGDFMVKVIPFIRQYNTFTSILEELKEKFHAGGVCESCVTEALAASLTDLQWEKECLKYCLICSSTPVDHPCTLPGPYSGKTASYLAREMAHKRGIIVSFVAPSTNKNWKPLFENSQIVHTSSSSKKDKSKQENAMEDETTELRVVNGTIEGTNLSRNASNDEKIIRLILEKSAKTTSSKKELIEFKPAFIELRGLQLNLSQQNTSSSTTSAQPLIPLKTANGVPTVISSPPLGTTPSSGNNLPTSSATSQVKTTGNTTTTMKQSKTTIAPKLLAQTQGSTQSSPEKATSGGTATNPVTVSPPQQQQHHPTRGSTPPPSSQQGKSSTSTISPPQTASNTSSDNTSVHSAVSTPLHSIVFSVEPNSNALFTLDLIHNNYLNVPDYPDQAKAFISKAPKTCDIKRVAHQSIPQNLKACLDKHTFFYLWKTKDESSRFESFYKTVNDKQFLIALPVTVPPRDNEQQESQPNVRFLVFITSEMYKTLKSKENSKASYYDIPDKLFISYVVDKNTFLSMVKQSSKGTTQPSSSLSQRPPNNAHLQPATTTTTNPVGGVSTSQGSQMSTTTAATGLVGNNPGTTSAIGGTDASALTLAALAAQQGNPLTVGTVGNTRINMPPNTTFIPSGMSGMPLMYNPFFSPQGLMMMPGGTQLFINPSMLGGGLLQPNITGSQQPSQPQPNTGGTGTSQPNNAKK